MSGKLPLKKKKISLCEKWEIFIQNKMSSNIKEKKVAEDTDAFFS